MQGLKFKKRRCLPFFLLALSLLLVVFIVLFIALSPIYYEISKAGCTNHTRSLLYKSILDISKNENFESLTQITETDGNIRSITLNTAKANHIRSLLATRINALYDDKLYATYEIPLGNLFMSPLLSGRGPSIPVRIVPLGGFEADIISEFSEAGINQTKHSVYIEARANVRLISPFATEEYESVTRVPLTETVIIGDVPNLYAKSK